MRAAYNFHWDTPGNQGSGVSRYSFSVLQNGITVYTADVYGNSQEVWLDENTSIHAEIRTIDTAGQTSGPAGTDFSVPSYIPPCPDTPPCPDLPIPPIPDPPGNFGADFVRWEV